MIGWCPSSPWILSSWNDIYLAIVVGQKLIMDGDLNPKNGPDRSRNQTLSVYQFDTDELFGEKPSAYLIGLLYRVTLMDKGFESSSFEGIKPNTARKYIERLNDLLTELFQINQPPITYNRKAGQYEIGFVCEKDLTQDEITPESNTPGGITIPKTKTRFDQNQ